MFSHVKNHPSRASPQNQHPLHSRAARSQGMSARPALAKAGMRLEHRQPSPPQEPSQSRGKQSSHERRNESINLRDLKEPKVHERDRSSVFLEFFAVRKYVFPRKNSPEPRQRPRSTSPQSRAARSRGTSARPALAKAGMRLEYRQPSPPQEPPQSRGKQPDHERRNESINLRERKEPKVHERKHISVFLEFFAV